MLVGERQMEEGRILSGIGGVILLISSIFGLAWIFAIIVPGFSPSSPFLLGGIVMGVLLDFICSLILMAVKDGAIVLVAGIIGIVSSILLVGAVLGIIGAVGGLFGIIGGGLLLAVSSKTSVASTEKLHESKE